MNTSSRKNSHHHNSSSSSHSLENVFDSSFMSIPSTFRENLSVFLLALISSFEFARVRMSPSFIFWINSFFAISPAVFFWRPVLKRLVLRCVLRRLCVRSWTTLFSGYKLSSDDGEPWQSHCVELYRDARTSRRRVIRGVELRRKEERVRDPRSASHWTILVAFGWEWLNPGHKGQDVEESQPDLCITENISYCRMHRRFSHSMNTNTKSNKHSAWVFYSLAF